MPNPHDKDLDEDLDELEEGSQDEDDSDDEDSDEHSSEEKGKKKKSKDDSEEDSDVEEAVAEVLEEESGTEDSRKAAKEAELEAKRARRRRERKLKREKQRREYSNMQNTIAGLQKQLQDIAKGGAALQQNVAQITDQQINSEINELTHTYNNCQAAMEKAIAENDGAAFTRAKNISDKAWARFNTLNLAKQQRAQQRQQYSQQNTQKEQSVGIELGEDAKRYGVAWARKNSDWYDASGGNLDSRIVQAIDADLYNEGYDPESKDYWDELTDRVKERLPHRFKNQTVKSKKPPQIVGGSGNGGDSPGGVENTLPKELVASLKQAGMWDDKDLRKKAIKDYMQNRKRSA